MDSAIKRSKAHVLVIDDDISVTNLLKLILRRSGYDVSVFNSGRSGVDYFCANFNKIDTVLLDVQLPDMDVRDILPALADCKPRVKILLCTGLAAEDKLDELRNSVCGVLQKPFYTQELLNKLGQLD